MTYEPAEDSYLLKRYLEDRDLENYRVLDMGTGSGILAITASKDAEEVVAVDRDQEALEEAERNASEENVDEKITFIQSDLFRNVKGKFDLIVFNPPYLPGEDYQELDGGEEGVEIMERFLEKVDSYLENEGEAVFIASDRSELDRLKKKFDLDKVDEEKLWFETLYLLKKSD